MVIGAAGRRGPARSCRFCGADRYRVECRV